MEGRRVISIWFLLILGLAIGFVIENVRAGLLIGLVIGLCTIGLLAGRKGKGDK
jgi:hypothetical protein